MAPGYTGHAELSSIPLSNGISNDLRKLKVNNISVMKKRLSRESEVYINTHTHTYPNIYDFLQPTFI